MKKFVKISLIVTITIMLLGIVLFIIGYAGGGRKEIAQMEENGELSYFNNHVRLNVGWVNNQFGIGFTDGDKENWLMGFGNPEAPEAPDAPEVPEVSGSSSKFKGSTNTALSIEGIEKLDIELGGGELFLEAGDVEEIQIKAKTEDDFQCYVKNNTLYVKGFDLKKKVWDWNDWDNRRQNSVSVIIPKKLIFRETDIEFGAGNIEITDVTLGKTDVEVGAGTLKCDGVNMEEVSVEVGAGAVYMNEITADKTELSVAMGEAVLDGTFMGNMDLQCSMGNLEINVRGKETDYNYEIEAAMGSVEVAGESYNGLASERSVNNHADKTICVEASMGSITVSFAE